MHGVVPSSGNARALSGNAWAYLCCCEYHYFAKEATRNEVVNKSYVLKGFLAPPCVASERDTINSPSN